jgi:hypothetical protein
MGREDEDLIQAIRAIMGEYREMLADNARWTLLEDALTVEAVDAIPGVAGSPPGVRCHFLVALDCGEDREVVIYIPRRPDGSAALHIEIPGPQGRQMTEAIDRLFWRAAKGGGERS